MDLRNLSIDERRKKIEDETKIKLDLLSPNPEAIGQANEKNCENMFGAIPVPVGYAGPLPILFSSSQKVDVHLPLATTEGALVASVNRGCKALRECEVATNHEYHGISRSIAFEVEDPKKFIAEVKAQEAQWQQVGEATSSHLKILKYETYQDGSFVFINIFADTDEAMGMNMVTIAANAIGDWFEKNLSALFITAAANVDSDKKPSALTKEGGRGYSVIAKTVLTPGVIESVLKTTPEAILKVADAKLNSGSKLAGAIGSNCHIGNVLAALYIATGQDPAHISEGAMGQTTVIKAKNGLEISVKLPAVIVGIRGGGTTLPAQKQCLDLLLKNDTGLHPVKQLAETIGAACLAGEVSLLGALANHNLASAHKDLGR